MSSPSFLRPEQLWHSVGLGANQTVAHLGCGPGFYAVPAAEIVGDKGTVWCVDILPHLLQEVESRAKRQNVHKAIRTVRADLEKDTGSTLENESVDWVLVANILHQADPSLLFKEAKRIVKPSGKVVVIDWDVAASPLGPPPDVRIPVGQVIEWGEEFGLHRTHQWRPSPYHYGVVFQKTV